MLLIDFQRIVLIVFCLDIWIKTIAPIPNAVFAMLPFQYRQMILAICIDDYGNPRIVMTFCIFAMLQFVIAYCNESAVFHLLRYILI